MIAERENEKLNVERESRLLIVAKAKIFSSEGWKVVVTDGEGKSYEPEEFDQLLPVWGLRASEPQAIT
jgi:hypothetical protein